MAIHTLTLTDKSYCHSGNEYLKIEGQKCHAGFIITGREGRKVFQGPMVSGPYGFVSLCATVISAQYFPEPEPISVSVGDYIVADDTIYKVIVNPRSRSKRDSDHYALENVITLD